MASEGSSGSLYVDITELYYYGEYLTGLMTTMEGQFKELRTCFAGVGVAWDDKNGHDLVTAFGTFLDKAQPVLDELTSLGSYATNESIKYNSILNDAKTALSR